MDLKKKNLAANVISGLQYLHELSIIHRDIKSKNILIKSDNTACIADFGVSKSINSITCSSANNLRIVGTPYYMAPEICTSRDIIYTFKSDYYALGIILWEIFENNSSPYKAEYTSIYYFENPQEIAPYIHSNKLRPRFDRLANDPTLAELKLQISHLWDSCPDKRPNELMTTLQIINRITVQSSQK